MAHGHVGIDRLLEEPAYARAVSDTLQALGTPSRLRILSRLHSAPASVSQLAEAVGMEASAVSHQLRMLRHLGLVVGARDGRQVVYQLHDDHVAELLTQAVGHVEHVRLGLAGHTREAPEALA
ncbi:MAG: czrA 1 [Solirubrobacterales bacterium]|nr:czrA 1 [Solirubrobacterales bacterium]